MSDTASVATTPVASGRPKGHLAAAGLVASVAVLGCSAVSGTHVRLAVVLVAVAALASFVRSAILPWPRLVASLILVVLFIPIRRYAFPGSLPFQLEPYRVLVALLVLGWVIGLLVDPRVRPRTTGFEGPLALIVAGVFGSVITNGARVGESASEINKAVTFFLSYLFLVYMIVSVIRRFDHIELLVKVMVVGGTLVALEAVFEARTGWNLFNDLPKVMPILKPIADPTEALARVGTGKSRVFASAQHPIALGAALVMLMPLALYLARRYHQRRWHVCAIALGAGCVSTISRTGVSMIVVAALTFLWLRPADIRRMSWAIVPGLLAVHIALPGTLGALKQSFMPSGGLIAQQQYGAGQSSHARLAAFGPAITMWQKQPLFGRGYGAPVSIWGSENLDDQWLGTLLTTGIVGFIGWLWLICRAVRRLGQEAKRDTTERGWLLAALTASIAGFAAGMLTFDAFAFIQVTLLLFIGLAFGAALLADDMPRPASELEPSQRRGDAVPVG